MVQLCGGYIGALWRDYCVNGYKNLLAKTGHKKKKEKFPGRPVTGVILTFKFLVLS